MLTPGAFLVAQSEKNLLRRKPCLTVLPLGRKIPGVRQQLRPCPRWAAVKECGMVSRLKRSPPR